MGDLTKTDELTTTFAPAAPRTPRSGRRAAAQADTPAAAPADPGDAFASTAALTRLPASDRARPATAAQHIERVLRRGILSGALPGGTALRQEALAAAFGVSRMPVREALNHLQAQALIAQLPHRGAVVADISAADAADVTAIRAALEPAALRLAIPRLDQAALDRAAALIEAIEQEADPSRMGDLNRDFHMALYGPAAQPRLLALIDQHLRAADVPLRFQLAALGHQAMSNEDHWSMWAAAREGRTEEACAILERHIRHGGESLTTFLAERALSAGAKPASEAPGAKRASGTGQSSRRAK